MGILKAAISSIGGNLADQWLETIEPEKMDNTVLSSYGVFVRKDDKRSSNKKGTEDVVSNGSIIHVPENTYMLLVDGGKLIAATDESGYYQVDNTRSPSFFFQSEKEVEGYHNTNQNAISRPGGLKNTLKDTWERFKFSGTTPQKQQVIYVNKMEIPNIRFGTKHPVPYTDRVLIPGRVVPCKITSFGSYSIKISDPMLFYKEVCGKSGKQTLTVSDLAEQYIDEFLMAYQTALASLSMEQVLVSDIPIRTSQLGKYMADALDEEWLLKRGFFIHSVGIAGIQYDEQTDKLLSQYGNDSILLDPNARAARLAGGIAKGFENAGSNEGGSMMGFAGIGMAMNAMGNLSDSLNPKVAPQSAATPKQIWNCSCGKENPQESNFCGQCGGKKPTSSPKWTCSCGTENDGNFCGKCGQPKASSGTFSCSKCGYKKENLSEIPKFCPNCGQPADQ